VEVGGQTYVVNLGKDAELLKQAKKLDDKSVRVTGSLAGFLSVTTMCVPGTTQLPVVQVQSLNADTRR
jgi:hypothetical protein